MSSLGSGVSRVLRRSALLDGDLPALEAETREEALRLLSESARQGSVTAQVALVTALSEPVRDPVEIARDEIARKRLARATG